jgi:putative ABC transport system permease protein
MENNAREICLKTFGYEVKGQAVYNGVKTTPSLLIVGTNRSFLTANAFTLGYGRNLNDEDVELSRRVIVVGKMIEKRLFPHESPIGKVVRVSGHTYTIVGVLAEKGTSFGQSQDDICFMPITRFFEDYGEAKRTVNIATQAFSTETYNQTLDKGISAMRIARGLRATGKRFRNLFQRLTQERVHICRGRRAYRCVCLSASLRSWLPGSAL